VRVPGEARTQLGRTSVAPPSDPAGYRAITRSPAPPTRWPGMTTTFRTSTAISEPRPGVRRRSPYLEEPEAGTPGACGSWA
jgi:hypothetical protein